MARIVLRRGRAKPIWHGHPWVYSGAVARVEGEAEPGEAVDVVDDRGSFIGRGFYNPRSQIVCRVATRRDEPLDAGFVRRRVREARELRARLGLPSDRTTAYRLVNSEGDGLPGAFVDVYGEVCAVQFSALGMARLRGALCDAIEAELAPRAIVEVGAGSFAELEGFDAIVGALRGEHAGPAACLEDGLRLRVDPLSGQKTGLYLDQRDNRALFGRLAAGRRALDLYCYAGGFALCAARGGAASVAAVDISGKALAQARAHAHDNGLAIETVEADAFRFLEAAEPGGCDLVSLDPPTFARARKDLEAALKGYRKLNALAMRALCEGGLLATSSCSQMVSSEAFERVLSAAAIDAGCRLRVLHVAGAAPDHPVPPGFGEGRYLCFLVCEVRPA